MAKSKKSFSLWKLIFLALIGIFIYYYNTDPQFKRKVDTKVTTVITMAEDRLGITILDKKVQPAKQVTTSKSQQKAAPEPQTADKTEEVVTAEEPSTEDLAQTAVSEGLIRLPENLAFPVCPGNKNSKYHERRDYTHYSICYREPYEQAEWSAYCLEEKELVKNAGRSDDFRPDPQISTGSATLADYKGSGYDRGHLSPAADFAFDQNAMSETFYMSNMSPQAGSFNRGIWKDLESQVRVWAKKFGKIYVISGPILNQPATEYETIGANKVSIPKYYYKVLLAPLYKDAEDRATPDDAERVTAIAFIFPNKKLTDSYFNYAVSVKEVEKRTGIDFFAGLDDDLENMIESTYNEDLWK